MKGHAATVVLLLLVGTASSAWWWSSQRHIETTDNAYVAGDISEVSSELDGRIATVFATDNEAVRAGDILAVLEDREYRSGVSQAEAALVSSHSAEQTGGRQIVYQESKIQEAKAILSGAVAELDRAKAAYERKKKLVANKIIAVQELEEATATFLKADSDFRRASASLSTDRAQLDVLIATQKQLSADTVAAQETLAMAKIRLDKTIIRSPISGVVGDRSIRTGQYVRPGTHLLSVVPNQVHIVANFKETQFQDMRPGQEVRVTVDAFPNSEMKGTIDSFSPASGSEFALLPPENATGNFTKVVRRLPVRILIADDASLHGLLRPGLSVEVSVDTASDKNATTIAAHSGWLFGAAFASESK